jgi:hypothetical protein
MMILVPAAFAGRTSEECRRFASEIGDPKVSRILSRAADDLERHARESLGVPPFLN